MKKYIPLMFLFVIYSLHTLAQVTFSGTAYHSPQQKVWLMNFFGKKLDSAIIKPDSITFTLKTEATKERLLLIKYEKIGPYERNQFIVMPGEHVVFSFNASSTDKYQWINVSGSTFTQERIALYKYILPYRMKVESINYEIDSVNEHHPGIDTSALQASMDQNQQIIDRAEMKVLDTTKSMQNAHSVFAWLAQSYMTNAKAKDSLLMVFKSHFSDDKSIQALTVSAVLPHPQLEIGIKAPDIILKDVNGVTIDLNKIAYKYLLIHFWASWCVPCRQQSTDLLKVSNEFNKKGFKIVMISIDADEKAWKNAIKADGTSGLIHLIDPDIKSKYLAAYKIFGIPDNFLIDESGNIIEILNATNLYSSVLKLLK